MQLLNYKKRGDEIEINIIDRGENYSLRIGTLDEIFSEREINDDVKQFANAVRDYFKTRETAQ